LRATGFVRRIDALGRIVLPVELRTSLGIKEKSSVSIRREGNLLILEAYSRGCVFCGSDGSLTEYKGYPILRRVHGRYCTTSCDNRVNASFRAQDRPVQGALTNVHTKK